MDVLILICALGIANADCSADTATVVVQGPEAGGPTMCGLHGQAYIAGTAIADYLRDGHYLKLACTRQGASLGAMHARR
jgi:hypothetical protein